MCITGKYVDFDNCWIYKKRKKFKSLKSKKTALKAKSVKCMMSNHKKYFDYTGNMRMFKKNENVGKMKMLEI